MANHSYKSVPPWTFKTSAPTTWGGTGDDKSQYMGWQNAPNAKEGYTYWKKTGDAGYDELMSQWLTSMYSYGQNTPEAKALYDKLTAYKLTTDPNAPKPELPQFPDSKQYSNEEYIKSLFGEQKAALGQSRASGMAQAGRASGAQAAARGLANPGAYQSAVSSQIAAPYAQAFSQLGVGEAGAQMQNKQWMAQMDAEKAKYLEYQRQYEKSTSQADRQFYAQLAQQSLQFVQQMELQRQAQTPGWDDYAGFATSILSAGLPLAFPMTFGMGALGKRRRY